LPPFKSRAAKLTFWSTMRGSNGMHRWRNSPSKSSVPAWRPITSALCGAFAR
jgi:hypothetical protein